MAGDGVALKEKNSAGMGLGEKNSKLGKKIFTPSPFPRNTPPIHILRLSRSALIDGNLPEFEGGSPLSARISEPPGIRIMDTSIDKLIRPTDPNPVDWDERLTDANKRTRKGVKLSMREVRSMIEIWGLPPFLTADEAAKISNRSTSVLRNHVSEGRFPRSAIVGKPLTFVTTRFIQEVAARLGGSV